jgi:hypothetical protein
VRDCPHPDCRALVRNHQPNRNLETLAGIGTAHETWAFDLSAPAEPSPVPRPSVVEPDRFRLDGDVLLEEAEVRKAHRYQGPLRSFEAGRVILFLHDVAAGGEYRVELPVPEPGDSVSGWHFWRAVSGFDDTVVAAATSAGSDPAAVTEAIADALRGQRVRACVGPRLPEQAPVLVRTWALPETAKGEPPADPGGVPL